MIKTHPLFHKFKFIVGYSVAISVILVALGVSGLRLLLTSANLYQNEVEQLASSLLNQPVKIGRMDAKLSGLVPMLIFHNVELVSKETKKSLLSLARIDVGLSLDDLIWKQKITPIQLTIRGMDLNITRTVEGVIKIKGVDLDGLNKADNKESDDFIENWLSRQSEIGIEDSFFIWKDEQNAGITWFFDDISLLLKNSEDRHQLLLSSNLPGVLGDSVKLAIDLVGDIFLPETWEAKVFVESKKINLKPLKPYIGKKNFKLKDGIVDLKLWAEWENNNIKQLSGDVKLYNFSYQNNKRKAVSLKYISGIFDSHRDKNNNWNISVEKFNYENSKSILNEAGFSLAFNDKNSLFEQMYITADNIKLESLSEIIIDNHLFSVKNEKLLKQLNLHGEVNDFYLTIQNDEIHRIKAGFKNAGLNSWKGIPKFDAVSGDINYINKEGIINLSSNNSVIAFPDLFRHEFKLDEINANILFSNNKEGWFFDVQHLLAKNIEVETRSVAKLWIPKNETSPYLDLQTYVTEGDVSKVSRFLPVTIMEDSLVKWIDESLVAGKVGKGTVIFNGKLDEFPFDNKEGKFSVDVDASDVIMDYQKNWPKITKARIKANFTGQGMNLQLSKGNVEKNTLYNSSVIINSFSKAELEIKLKAKGASLDTMKYLANSPILSGAKKTINEIRWSGRAETNIEINIPLDDELSKKKELAYSGYTKLNKVSLFMLEDKINLTDVSGNIYFTDGVFSSKNLNGIILGEKAPLSVVTGKKNKEIRISTKIKVKPGMILKKFDIPGADKITGFSSFNAAMIFSGENSHIQHPTLKLTSNLLGVKSALPDSFFKRANKRQNFSFETRFIGNNKVQLGVAFAKKGSAIMELDLSGKSAYLKKGAIAVSARKAVLPKKNILYIDGSIKKITPSKWSYALGQRKTKKPSRFLVNPVVLNLDKLKILTSKKDNKNNIPRPQNLPAFEGIIKKLYVNKINYGRVDFKTSKKKYGQHLDELIVSSKNMQLIAQGDWRYNRGKHNTKLNITLSSSNFGRMLTDLGYSAVIRNGTAKTTGTVYWLGAPTQFLLEELNGDIQLSIENGNIKDVDSGAGRLLGLFSLSALPRKLFGDFKDSLDDGFNFDTASGQIIIEDGDAYTEDFEIKSPIATINVSGRTGLADEDYENTVEVVPEVGSGVAGVTALLVNLPAGIGIWLLDKLTGEQFNEASTKMYEISGSWDEPEIEEIIEE